MRTSNVVLALLALVAPVAEAQFVVPLPRSIDGNDPGFRASRIRNDFSVYLQDHNTPLTDAAIREAHDTFCRDVVEARVREDEAQANDPKLCRESVTVDDVLDSAGERIHADPYRRWLLKGFARPREDLLPLYDSAGAGDFSALNRFSTNVTDDKMFLVTEMFSGLVGQFIVAVTHAAVVTTADGKKAQSDTVAITELNAIEDNTATITRLVNNGGTMSVRVQAPFLVGGGANIQQAASLYLQTGVIGPLGNTDSLRASAALVLEYMAAFAARKPNRSYESVGDLLIGLRGGRIQSEDELMPSSRHNGMWFLQGAFGIRKGTSVTASLLVTFVEKRYRDFVPKLVINFSALRL
jgi:hypothetical protein